MSALPALATPAGSAAVRQWVVEQLRLDLIGPVASDLDLLSEALSINPSRWYLTGWLVPATASDEQRAGDADTEGDLDSGDDAGGADDQGVPDKAAARKAWRPSSMGLSFLVERDAQVVDVEVAWGDYKLIETKNAKADVPTEGEHAGEGEAETPPAADQAGGEGKRWEREHRAETIRVDLMRRRAEIDVPGSGGLRLAVLVRPMSLGTETGDRQVKAVSIFLVNRREPVEEDGRGDEAFAFQASLAIRSEHPFVPRPDLRGLDADDPDERIADLQYRDVAELAVGHNVSAEWSWEADGSCRRIATSWTPLASVPRVIPNETIAGFELGMETLGALTDAAEAKAKLTGGVAAYRTWLGEQRATIAGLDPRRAEVADQLLNEAEAAAARIADGLACLERPEALEAFRIANRAVARAARQRDAQIRKTEPDKLPPPKWRPFQLAFILLNLRGLVEPTHDDRRTVDLLFFPTGGGKTEAYLGLAAFAIAYRRLVNPGLTGAGLTVLMRYTLRLLTLDQLGRAAAVVCALELERQAGTAKLGEWPIEIGLWVGRAATPNRIGRKGDNDRNHRTARWKVIDYLRNSKNPLPVPIRTCPWCGTPFDRNSFDLSPNGDNPENLWLRCVNRRCEFHLSKRNQPLPILTVDEPIYRRLPAFMIATVDKFAGMPWTGEIASFFGGADRNDGAGFYGPAEPEPGVALAKPLDPPDLIIQDELHLISGPLGTMVGLYETAIDRLCARSIEGKDVRPKIVASTATVRRAQRQIRALFNRRNAVVFPPPGPERRDSFFAHTLPPDEAGARHYLGVAAPGGSPKVLFLRVLVTLMAAAETAWRRSAPDDKNPADPYMTLLGYFNALRELGGARRIVEGEVGPRLRNYAKRLRIGETARFADREIKYEVMELTSRVPTDEVSEAKRRLASLFSNRDDRVDVALATNMISVGLDITRLGLMVVSGQPKATAEYIQATSRVGREAAKPGLVVALLNVNKPRDRSHYERFCHWHAAFYRGVEATSVTPFSPRALDRGLPAVSVALGRLGLPQFTPGGAAQRAHTERGLLDFVADVVAERAAEHQRWNSATERQQFHDHVHQRVVGLLDAWATRAREVGDGGGRLGYQKADRLNQYLLREMLDRELATREQRRFRAPRSLRDVEAAVLVKLQAPDGQPLDQAP